MFFGFRGTSVKLVVKNCFGISVDEYSVFLVIMFGCQRLHGLVGFCLVLGCELDYCSTGFSKCAPFRSKGRG